MSKLKEDLKKYYIYIILIALYFFLMQILFKTWCPIKAIFGIDCPGCGLTHASVYLITGRIKDAIEANYSIFFWWTFFITFFIDRYIHPLKIKPFPYILIIACIVTMIRYVLNIILQ